MPAQTVISSTTQQFLDIYDITNDLLIMKDGSTSLIVTVDAMNFGLLAEEEQDAIMYAYAGLLNSLNYPIQIVIRSQTKDATNYLNLLKEQEVKASNEDKKKQIEAYRGFVGDLIRERNVLDKKFYIVIPASSLEMGLLPPQTVVPGIKQIDVSSVERSVILEKASTILEPKRDHLISQFARIGLYARQLVTQEIIQLFYTSYNPEAAEGQQITHTSDYTTALVSSQTQMTDTNTQPTPVLSPPTPQTPQSVPEPMAMPSAPLTTEAPMMAPSPAGEPVPNTPPTTSTEPSSAPAPAPTDTMAPAPTSGPSTTTIEALTPTSAPVATPADPTASPLSMTPPPAMPQPAMAPAAPSFPSSIPSMTPPGSVTDSGVMPQPTPPTMGTPPTPGTEPSSAPSVPPASPPAPGEPMAPVATPAPVSTDPAVQAAQELINVTAQQVGGSNTPSA